ncbi:MAG TPA: hypothetical protein VHR18_08205 [Solirubrobacterales bacterium]|jgi:hypothetical protein|nr:hypothetical protein [Solirubrobacterales bacterium]
MQINRTGYFLIALFGLLGLAMCIGPVLAGAPGEASLILASTGAIFVLVAAGLGWYARHAARKAAHNDWIFRNGIKGTATILDVGNSHTTVNEMPLMKLKLDVDIPGVGRTEFTRREVMPVFSANQMREGLVLPVYANPGKPGEFILVW